MRSRHVLAMLVVLVAAACGSATTIGPAADPDVAPAASADVAANGLRTFRVRLVNLTGGQPFSPPVAATHRATIHVFQIGTLASNPLELIAEDGNQVPMFNRLTGSPAVTQAVDLGAPVTAGQAVTFRIRGRAGDRFSLATMLICTNDGFLGLDAVELPASGSKMFAANGYDAGTENNSQHSRDIVDPCSLLNPSHPLPGDPNGNEDAAVDTDPPRVIRHHRGIQDHGALDPAFHGWTDPVARITITRVD